MRVLDIITENQNPLSRLETSMGASSSVNRLNHAPNEASYIKQQLERHRLVTGYNHTTGQRTLGGMAWTGSIDQQWTPELDRAITAWKRSINLQVSGTERRPLDVNPNAPGIIRADLQYLIYTELGSDGLLDTTTSGRLAPAPASNPGQLSGMTYSETIPGTREQVLDDPTARTLYDAIGWSAWWRIAGEIEQNSRARTNRDWEELSHNERAQEIRNRQDRTFNRNLTSAVDGQWLTNVQNGAGNSVATYADGTTQPINVTAVLGASPRAPDIFDYYSNMALKLWERDRQNRTQSRQAAADVAANPVTATTLDDTSLRAIAAQLDAAFRNDPVAGVLPGGRTFFNDIDAIEQALGRLRTAADFDNLSTIYTEVSGGNILHEKLFEELDKDDYTRLVVSKLLSIRRIAPRIIHANINFGEAEEVEVTIDNNTYRVQRELGPNGEPVIEGYNGNNDYDAIVIDNILRSAIEASGSALPDFDSPASDEAVAEAQLAFINTIQITYPEMVPFYVRAEPFDGASVDIGGARLRGIIDDAARMGGDQAAMANYITQEILNDRTWLIGDDDTEPAASIRFDERYATEGLSNRDFPVVSADQDTELNASEEEIFENLKSTTPSVVREAVDEILQSDEPAQMWENIYRRAASQNLWLDEAANMGDGQRDIEEFLAGRDPGTNIIRIARGIASLAIAAPRVCAKMFYDAGRGRTGTDEETIDALIAQIRNRYDYEMIDERYRQLPGVDDSLIDDLASEQIQGLWGSGWYAALAAKIGDTRRLELIRTELDRSIMDALDDVERIPDTDNINTLQRATTGNRQFMNNQDQLRIVIERLNEVLGEITAESPEGVLLVGLVDTLREALDNL